MHRRMRICFFIPEHHAPDKERREAWLSGQIPSLLAGGKSASAQAWLFQTWAELRGQTDVELTNHIPDEGIIVTLANFLTPNFRATSKQHVCAVVADFQPHPGAQIQIIQNAAHAKRLRQALFVPHWPQPNLIPRTPARGDRFETIAFFGDRSNLCSVLLNPEFGKKLQEACGVRIEIRSAERWHDYSDVDAVLAIRDFSTARQLHKPATKLYNAWLAGVPFLAGSDSAYSAEAEPGRDYLVAKSEQHVLELLNELQKNPARRQALVAAGQKKTATRNRDAVRAIWLQLLNDELPSHLNRWKSKGENTQRMFWLKQRALLFVDRLLRS